MAIEFSDSLMRRLGMISNLGSDATQQTNAKMANKRQMLSSTQQNRAVSRRVGGGPTVGGGGGSYGGSRSSHEALMAFAKEAQRRGYKVAENPHIGNGRVGKHTKGSRHYSGRAVDINWAAGTSKAEQDMLAKLIPLSQQYGLRNIFMKPGHYGHAHFDY